MIHFSAHVPAGIVFIFLLVGALPAADLLTDGAPDAPTAVRTLLPDAPSAQKRDALHRFGQIFTPRFFNGQLTKDDVGRLVSLLEQECDSEWFIGFFMQVARGSKFTKECFDHLIRIAESNPRAMLLNLTAGEILVGEKQYKEAIPYLEQAFQCVLRMDVPPREGSRAERMVCAIAAKLLFCYNAENNDAAEERVFQSIHDTPNIPKGIVLAENMLCGSAAIDEKTEKFEPESVIIGLRGPEFSPRLVKYMRLQAAADDYLRLADKNPSSITVSPVILLALRRADRGKQLHEMLLMQLANDPGDRQNLLLFAGLCEENGDIALAARAMGQVIFGRPDTPTDQLIAYANILRKAKFYNKALAVYEILLSRTRNKTPILLEIVRTTLMAKHPRAAFERAEKLPDGFDKFFLQAAAFEELREYDKAFEFARKALDAAKSSNLFFIDNRFWFFYANLAEKCRRIEEVDRVMTPLLEKGKDDADLLNFIGYIFADHNYKLEDAHRYLQRAVELKPDSYEILDSMAWVLFRMNRFDLAKEFIDKGIRLADDKLDGVILDHAGDIYQATGDTESAKKFWDRALDNPGEADSDAIRKKLGLPPL